MLLRYCVPPPPFPPIGGGRGSGSSTAGTSLKLNNRGKKRHRPQGVLLPGSDPEPGSQANPPPPTGVAEASDEGQGGVLVNGRYGPIEEPEPAPEAEPTAPGPRPPPSPSSSGDEEFPSDASEPRHAGRGADGSDEEAGPGGDGAGGPEAGAGGGEEGGAAAGSRRRKRLVVEDDESSPDEAGLDGGSVEEISGNAAPGDTPSGVSAEAVGTGDGSGTRCAATSAETRGESAPGDAEDHPAAEESRARKPGETESVSPGESHEAGEVTVTERSASEAGGLMVAAAGGGGSSPEGEVGGSGTPPDPTPYETPTAARLAWERELGSLLEATCQLAEGFSAADAIGGVCAGRGFLGAGPPPPQGGEEFLTVPGPQWPRREPRVLSG